MALDVIGAGLGRTGTLSLKAALEQLGVGPCYHMVEVFAHPEHIPIWDAAARGEPVDWDELLRNYRSAVDWPPCAFYRELMERYPDAKVILTVRDPEAWYESARQTIFAASTAFPRWAGVFAPRMRRFGVMVNRLVWSGLFRGRFADKAFAIEQFQRHNDEVRRTVPDDRLLVYEVKEGWGPLCAFLGVPVPEGIPFPRLNDTAEFRERIARGRRRIRTLVAAALGVVVVTVGVVAWLVARHGS